jgi:hypothetical protein
VIVEPDPNVTSFVGVSFATHGTGLSSPTIPAHLAPVDLQKDAIIACLINSPNNTLPTMPAGQGWQMVGGNDAISGLAGDTLALRWIWKWAGTSAQVFGTPANATRAICWVYRFTVAPDTPFPSVGATTNPTKNHKISSVGGAVVRHVGHDIEQAAGHILSISVARQDVTLLQRTDVVNNGVIGQTQGKVMYGRSNGAVASWPLQDRTAGGLTETISSALELAA